MAIDTVVTDPSLKAVLVASREARQQAIDLLTLTSSPTTAALPPATAAVQISKQQKLLNGYLAQLRGLQRQATFGARDTKAQTAEARQEVDRLHLQLQNLYYEQRHLQGEIAACEAYECVPPQPPNGWKSVTNEMQPQIPRAPAHPRIRVPGPFPRARWR